MTLIYQNFNWLSLDRTLEPSSLLDSALDKIVESIEDEYEYWILLKQNLQLNSLKTETKYGCTTTESLQQKVSSTTSLCWDGTENILTV